MTTLLVTKVERADDTMSINNNNTDKITDRSCQNDVDFSNDASSSKCKVDKLGRKHKISQNGSGIGFQSKCTIPYTNNGSACQ